MAQQGGVILWLCVTLGVLMLAPFLGSKGAPVSDSNAAQAQPGDFDISEDDKQSWRNLQSAWAKQQAWHEPHGGLVKRAWNNLQSGWGKRTWENFHGSWGKRVPSELPTEREIFETNVLDQYGPVLSNSAEQALERSEIAEDSDEFDPEGEDIKRSWKNINAAWGKRADRSRWGNFQGSWGKREPGWNSMKGLWGKRDKWNKLSSAWGKRSDAMSEDYNRRHN